MNVIPQTPSLCYYLSLFPVHKHFSNISGQPIFKACLLCTGQTFLPVTIF